MPDIAILYGIELLALNPLIGNMILYLDLGKNQLKLKSQSNYRVGS